MPNLRSYDCLSQKVARIVQYHKETVARILVFGGRDWRTKGGAARNKKRSALGDGRRLPSADIGLEGAEANLCVTATESGPASVSARVLRLQ